MSLGGHHFSYDGWEGHVGVRDHTGEHCQEILGVWPFSA